MNKVANVYLTVYRVLRTYPAMSAAVLNVIVALAAYFGLHMTADQLAGFFAVTSIILGMVVHSNVVPLPKVKPVVPASALTAEQYNRGGYLPPATGTPTGPIPTRGGYPAGSTTVNELSTPPASVTHDPTLTDVR